MGSVRSSRRSRMRFRQVTSIACRTMSSRQAEGQAERIRKEYRAIRQDDSWRRLDSAKVDEAPGSRQDEGDDAEKILKEAFKDVQDVLNKKTDELEKLADSAKKEAKK